MESSWILSWTREKLERRRDSGQRPDLHLAALRDFSAIDGLWPRFAPFAPFFDHFGQFGTLRENCFRDVYSVLGGTSAGNFELVNAGADVSDLVRKAVT